MSMPPEMMQQQLAQNGQPPAQGGQGPRKQKGIPRGQGVPSPDAPVDEAALTAELQEAMRKASNILYEEAVFQSLSTMAQEVGPAEALAVTTVKILERLQNEGGEMAMEILFGVGMAIIADAADALQQGGIEVSEAQVTQGLQRAISTYLRENPDQFTPEELKQGMDGLKQGLQQLDMSEMEGSAADGGAPPAGLMGER